MRSSARFFTNLGLLNQVDLKYDLSLSYYDSAYAIAKQIGDYGRLQILAGYRAYINRDRGNYSQAQNQFREAIQLTNKLGKDRKLVDLYKGYAGTLYYLGQYRKALAAIDTSERIAQKFNDTRNVIITKLDRASFYNSLKQNSLANKTIREALELAKNNNFPYLENLAKAQLGEVLLHDGQYLMAREFLKEFVEYLSSNESFKKESYYWQGRLARTYFLEERYGHAKQAYLKALEASRVAESKTFEAWFLLRIGEIEFKTGNAKHAIQDFDLARKIAHEQNNNEILWEINFALGKVYEKSEDLDEAISAYKAAANNIEQNKDQFNADKLRIGYFIEGSQVYRNLLDCFRQRYETTGNLAALDSLLYFHQMSRSRVLRESHRTAKHPPYSSEYLQARRELRILQRKVREQAEHYERGKEWTNLLPDLEAARYTLLVQDLKKHDHSQEHVVVERPLIRSLKEVLEFSKQAEMGLLQYHISEESSFVIVVHNDEVKIVPLLLKPAQLAADIDSLIAPFHNVDARSIRTAVFKANIAHHLYQLLIKPVEQTLTLPDKILIVPDFALMKLPFEMLLMEQPEKSNYVTRDYPSYASNFLGLRYSFTYSPGSFLDTTPGDIPSNPNLLVIAYPFRSEAKNVVENGELRSKVGWRFDPLIYANLEAKAIKEINTNTKILEHGEATKLNLFEEAPKSLILHFATHAFADTMLPDFSGLVLAVSEDSTDDGLLMGYEIPDLNLECELVTLSACETGRGKVVVGEGVLGLPRQFIASGVKSVLMTHWKVDDKFASQVMPEFYRNYLKKGLSKSEALSNAKRRIIRSIEQTPNGYYQHPLYWAPFVLYGDPGQRRESLLLVYLAMLIVFLIVISLFIKKKVNIQS